MIEIKIKEKCCGCYACYNICPKNAIEMREDEKGFKYPEIDKDKCINCGQCEKKCPILNNEINNFNKKVYAAINKNEEERINSSSGGIFTLLAKEILDKEGVVFGAAFDENFIINHIYIDCIKDIDKLQGSKYAQSNIKDTYKKAKEFLNKDKYVLFTGTSCQIEGLRSYLMKDYDRLYTQDIICHGVPSPKVLKYYLNYQKGIYKEDIRSISFRNKDNGWSSYQMKIIFDSMTYNKPLNKDLYMKAFLRNTCLRDSCYSCSFKNNYRNSDITLADYWGAENVHPNIYDNKGTSVVIINTKKGEELFNNIKNNCIYEESQLEYVIKYNPSYVKSARKDKKSEEFFANLEYKDFDLLVNKYVSKQNFIIVFISKIKCKIKDILNKL